MFEIIALTHRALCTTDFLDQVEQIAAAGVSSIILREKDMDADAYEALLMQVTDICSAHGAVCIPHHFADAARRAGASSLHLSLDDLEAAPHVRKQFPILGVSVHSLEQARRAQALGADYVCAGHIFETDCKRGLAPRGLPFLQEICGALAIPAYAIGGIGPRNIGAVREAGAAGVCLMSSFMEQEPSALMARLCAALK